VYEPFVLIACESNTMMCEDGLKTPFVAVTPALIIFVAITDYLIEIVLIHCETGKLLNFFNVVVGVHNTLSFMEVFWPIGPPYFWWSKENNFLYTSDFIKEFVWRFMMAVRRKSRVSPPHSDVCLDH
jgi:hypothetical protein